MTQQTQDAEYAQQWITFLRKRNTILNIIWPLLFMISIAASIAAIYYYLESVNSRLNVADTNIQIAKHIESNASLLSSNETLHSQNEVLLSENEFLKSDKVKLSASQDDSVSQLDISKQIIQTLEAQVGTLKTEKIAMLDALGEAKALLIQQSKANASELSVRRNEFDREFKQLSKQLESRKVAYTALANRQNEMQFEIDRLVNVNQAAKSKLEKQISVRKLAETNAGRRFQEVVNLKAENKLLEQKLQLIASPVSEQSSETIISQNKGRGLDSIQAPKKQTQKTTQPKMKSSQKDQTNSLNFDQMSIN